MKITISKAAEKYIKTSKAHTLFIKFYKGGCAGYLYSFSLQPIQEEHKTYNLDFVNIVVYGNVGVSEINIDRESSIMGSRFVLKAESGFSCKCGSSIKGIKKLIF